MMEPWSTIPVPTTVLLGHRRHPRPQRARRRATSTTWRSSARSGRDLPQLVGHQHGRTDAGIIAEHVRAHELTTTLHRRPSAEHLRRPVRGTARRRRPPRAPAPGAPRARHPLRRRSAGGTACSPATPRTARGSSSPAPGFDVDVFDWDALVLRRRARSSAPASPPRAAAALAGTRAVIVGDTPRGRRGGRRRGHPVPGRRDGRLRRRRAPAHERAWPSHATAQQDAALIEDAIAALPPLADSRSAREPSGAVARPRASAAERAATASVAAQRRQVLLRHDLLLPTQQRRDEAPLRDSPAARTARTCSHTEPSGVRSTTNDSSPESGCPSSVP